MRILAICGSLRKPSSNHYILEAIAKICPPPSVFIIDDHIGKLPHFVPGEETPEIVLSFRAAIRNADAVIFCTPEYAHGMPGVLKNAIDWCVTSNDLFEKPVAVITASSSGERGHAALLQTLRAVTAAIIEDACLLLPFIRTKVNTDGSIEQETMVRLRRVLKEMIDFEKGK